MAGLGSPPLHAVLIQDTAWPGYEQIPGWIVAGYGTLCAEIDKQLAATGAGPPDLVGVPVGVGSLAHAALPHWPACAPLSPAPAPASAVPNWACTPPQHRVAQH
jgi:diaminopropionate ammonia-lyase